jgi:hypothetical protein
LGAAAAISVDDTGGEERDAPFVNFGSMCIERAFLVAALWATLTKQGPAP